MNLLKVTLLIILTAIGFGASAHEDDPNPNITPYNDAKEELAGFKIQYLKNHPAWQSFVSSNPAWGARFNRYTKLPHRAIGSPIQYGSPNQDLVTKSIEFINSNFAAFGIPTENLIPTRNFNDGKYINVDFTQSHNGLEVLWSNARVRYSQNKEIVMFGLDLHTKIPAKLNSSISAQQAKQFAESALVSTVVKSNVAADKKIIPIPVNGQYEYHIVYEVTTETQNTETMPGHYLSYVDAETGKIWYRDNKVRQIGFTVNADLYPSNLFAPSQLLELKHLRITDGSNTYYTDANGSVTLPGATFNGTIHLDGRYCDIVTGQNGTVSPSVTPSGILDNSIYTFLPGANNAVPQIQHFSTYYHVNLIHDYMKSKLPLFTTMDNPLTTRIDRTDGTCNAFYNGSSINFYTTAGGCNAFSLINTVVYHEYAHGITNVFYNSQGSNFQNGGMGEGYSDLWSMFITNDPIVGRGRAIGSPTSFVRRYDVNPKVYPQDLVGQVHADGEIIAGAWWATYNYWGDLDSVSSLFAQSHYGLATGPNGTEGEVYFDILIDALQYDDTDNNIVNGTPHFNFIVKGFADHGIYLLNNIEVEHGDLLNQNSGAPINVHAEVKADFSPFVGDINIVYREAGSTQTSKVLMTKNNLEYDVVFPSQTPGKIYEYYFEVSDNLNSYAVDFPKNVNFTTITPFERNLPYYVLIGYKVVYQELFNNATAPNGWAIGNNAGDNAIRGQWDFGVPIPSFQDPSDSSTVVQPYADYNGDGQCLFTGNASTPTASVGQEDVDGGKTTVISAPIDISGYTQPVLGYSRWFTNSQGDNPRKDRWDTEISFNGGTTWFPMERTFQPDVSWRRYVVQLPQGLGGNLQIRFTASDVPQQGQGGSIIEAAVDAVEIYDLGETPLSTAQLHKLNCYIFPNPATSSLNIVLPQSGEASVELLSSVGQVLFNKNVVSSGTPINISLANLSNGIYYLRAYQNGKMSIQKFTVAK